MAFVKITQEKYQEIEKEILELRRDKESLRNKLQSKWDCVIILQEAVQKKDATIKVLSNELEMSVKEYEDLLKDLNKEEADNQGLRKEVDHLRMQKQKMSTQLGLRIQEVWELKRKLKMYLTIEKLEKIETENKEYEAIEEKDLNKFRHNVNNKIESIDTKLKARISKTEALVEHLANQVNELVSLVERTEKIEQQKADDRVYKVQSEKADKKEFNRFRDDAFKRINEVNKKLRDRLYVLENKINGPLQPFNPDPTHTFLPFIQRENTGYPPPSPDIYRITCSDLAGDNIFITKDSNGKPMLTKQESNTATDPGQTD